MKSAILVLILGVTGFACRSSAATVSLGVVGAYMSSASSVSLNAANQTASPQTNSSYGGGALLFVNLPLITLETGALYVQRKEGVGLSLAGQSLNQLYTLNDIEIPAIVRLKLLPFLSFGLGVSYFMGQGNLQFDQSDPNNVAGGTFSRSESYSQANYAQSDLAYEASVMLKIPISGKADVIGEINYQLGATNLDTSGSTTSKANTLQVLAGLSFDL